MRIASAVEAVLRAPNISARLTARIVSHAFDIRIDEMFGLSRRPKFVNPRQIAMAIAHRQLRGRISGTLPAIGRVFGRDHTTVLHAVRKFGPLIESIVAPPPSYLQN